MSKETRPQLRVIRGGKADGSTGGVRIEAATPEKALTADAVVFEEDSWLILSAGMEMEVEVEAVTEHPVRLFTELHDAEPHAPGTVLIQGEQPLTLLAVVHDFGADPCCRLEWVATALGEVLRICGERQVVRLLLPVFGVRRGAMKAADIVPLAVRTIRAWAPPSLREVYLTVPPGSGGEFGHLISSGTDGG